jgi:uncharacterized SAM-binding protein YcdF (DUF218 family)
MTASRAVLLTLCSTALAVVALGGLYRGLQPASAAAARPPLVAPVGALSSGAAPAPVVPSAPTLSGDEYEYCRPGGPEPRLALGRYDAVFALGAGLASERADPRQVLIDGARLRPLGAWLAVTHFGASPTLGFAGGRTSGPALPSEAASMLRFVETSDFRAQFRRFATAQPREVILEEQSTSTDTNVAQILELARRHRWGRVLLVTNQYHVPRTRLLAELGHLPADVVPAEAIVDAALADSKVHDLFCARESGEGLGAAIRQERTYMTVMGLLRA